MKGQWMATLSALVLAAAAFVVPAEVDAFCGSYVSGGDTELFNNATQTAMMRDGQQTVLSMQNDYEGPTDEFAMIVPTPVVLQKENVQTLDDEIFDKLDTLTAPRLVEYWEKDPCEEETYYDGSPAAAGGTRDSSAEGDDSGEVTVEAEFIEGEYDIKVLSADESTALETWLTDNGYNIPDGAAPYLDPYIQQGSKFFVAKVIPEEVEFTEDGSAVLSPLRFNYESEEFKLPIRLGLINSKGKQDLIVNILAKDQRYKVANYPNALIPTNIEVVDAVRDNFGQFYRSLFRETLRQNKEDGQKPVVTEYSWNASTCDPCPGPVGGLTGDDLATLGADVIEGEGEYGPRVGSGWVVTRLHARYGEDEVGKDLVFEKAEAIEGGRGTPDENGNLEREPKSSNTNNFQGRYVILHRWDDAVLCSDPQYGRWGGSPDGGSDSPSATTAKSPNNGGLAVDSDDSDSETDLSKNIRDDLPELGVKANPDDGAESQQACSLYRFGDGSGLPLSLLALFGGFGLFAWRRRRN